MYYENKKNGFWGVLLPLLILGFLSIIVVILVNLINRVDVMETGTDTVLNDFGIENLVENSSYSIVRSI